jgi:hypothetical protein
MVSAMEIPEKINELLMLATDEDEEIMILELLARTAVIMLENRGRPRGASIH